MKAVALTTPELVRAFGTRALIGAGFALLLSIRLGAKQRQRVGWALTAWGAFATIPLVLELWSAKISTQNIPTRSEPVERQAPLDQSVRDAVTELATR
jgi:hypothetical protein